MTARIQSQTLKEVFTEAESKRRQLDDLQNSNTDEFQHTLLSAIATYERCLEFVEKLSLFSPNEDIDDLSSDTLQYALN
jgi:immunoglobulin-binding protein 1